MIVFIEDEFSIVMYTPNSKKAALGIGYWEAFVWRSLIVFVAQTLAAQLPMPKATFFELGVYVTLVSLPK